LVEMLLDVKARLTIVLHKLLFEFYPGLERHNPSRFNRNNFSRFGIATGSF